MFKITCLGNQANQILLPRGLFIHHKTTRWKMLDRWFPQATRLVDGSPTPKVWWRISNQTFSPKVMVRLHLSLLSFYLFPRNYYTLGQVSGSMPLLSSWEHTLSLGHTGHIFWVTPEGGFTWPVSDPSHYTRTEVTLFCLTLSPKSIWNLKHCRPWILEQKPKL